MTKPRTAIEILQRRQEWEESPAVKDWRKAVGNLPTKVFGHLFSYMFKDPDRQTTKNQWKAISWWLRVCRNKVEDKLKPQINQHITDLLCFGSTVVKVD